MQNWIKAAAIAVSLTLPGVALAQSLESLVNVQGVRENQLVGYSLVVGLDGTGDKNQVKFTNQTITNMLRQFGVQLPNKIDPKVKNVAAVAVSATLPPMYSRQQNIDDQMSKIQDEGDQLTDTYNANYDRYLEEYTNTLVEVYTMKASMAAFA